MFCGNIVAQIYNKPRSNQKNPSFRFINPPFLDPQKTPSGKKNPLTQNSPFPLRAVRCPTAGRRERRGASPLPALFAAPNTLSSSDNRRRALRMLKFS